MASSKQPCAVSVDRLVVVVVVVGDLGVVPRTHGSAEQAVWPVEMQFRRCCSPASQNTPTASTLMATTSTIRTGHRFCLGYAATYTDDGRAPRRSSTALNPAVAALDPCLSVGASPYLAAVGIQRLECTNCGGAELLTIASLV